MVAGQDFDLSPTFRRPASNLPDSRGCRSLLLPSWRATRCTGVMRGLVGGVLTVNGQAFEQRKKRQTLIPRSLAVCIDDIVAFKALMGREVDLCFEADLFRQFGVGPGNGLIIWLRQSRVGRVC